MEDSVMSLSLLDVLDRLLARAEPFLQQISSLAIRELRTFDAVRIVGELDGELAIPLLYCAMRQRAILLLVVQVNLVE